LYCTRTFDSTIRKEGIVVDNDRIRLRCARMQLDLAEEEETRFPNRLHRSVEQFY
jgi:hypothetical protein